MPTPRKSTRQKLNEGDARKVGVHVLRRQLAAEPQAQVGLPRAPEYLPEIARDCYEVWREQLRLMHLDNAPDSIALEAAALAYCRATEAEAIVTREGQVVDDVVFYKGKPVAAVTRKKKHPATTVANRNWLVLKAFLVEFGLTPAARKRVSRIT